MTHSTRKYQSADLRFFQRLPLIEPRAINEVKMCKHHRTKRTNQFNLTSLTKNFHRTGKTSETRKAFQINRSLALQIEFVIVEIRLLRN